MDYRKLLEKAIDYAAVNDSFNSINRVKNAGTVAVFGLGTYFREAFASQKIKEKYNVTVLCDNDPEKWGKYYEGLKCVSPKELQTYENVIAIIMIGNSLSVEKQLRELGISYVKHTSLMLDAIMGMETDGEWFLSQREDILSVYDMLSDEASKRLYAQCLAKRLATDVTDFEWDELYCREKHYFNDNYYKITDNEVYVDCGAYIGDSVLDFCNYVKAYDKIYAFEMDGENFAAMSNNLKGRNSIFQYNYGVWSCDKELEYGIGTSDNEPMEGISVFKKEEGKNNHIRTVKVKALDSLLSGEKVTFLKMDIEGAEIEAIKGARRIIFEQKPKLAICLYHRTSDFWQIPLLLHEINPEYHFAIMHHSKEETDTILYAVQH